MEINFNSIKNQELTIGDLQRMEQSIIHMQGTNKANPLVTSFPAQESLGFSNLTNQESSGNGFQYPATKNLKEREK